MIGGLKERVAIKGTWVLGVVFTLVWQSKTTLAKVVIREVTTSTKTSFRVLVVLKANHVVLGPERPEICSEDMVSIVLGMTREWVYDPVVFLVGPEGRNMNDP